MTNIAKLCRDLKTLISLTVLQFMINFGRAVEVSESSVQCDPQQMHVFFEFKEPFYGTVFAKGFHNTEHCRLYGEGSRKLSISYHLNHRPHEDPYCGMRLHQGKQEFYIGLVLSDQREILVDGVREFQVHCSYLLQDVTIKLPSLQGIQISSAHDNVAHEPPTVLKGASTGILPVIEMTVREGWGIEGRRIQAAAIGQEITLDVHLAESVPYDFLIFNCIAHDGSRLPGGTVTLVDDKGCAQIIDRVQEGTAQALTDHKDIKHTYLRMRGFQFSTSDVVNFECQIRPCLNKCNLTQCSVDPFEKQPGIQRRSLNNLSPSQFEYDTISLDNEGSDNSTLEVQTSVVMLPENSRWIDGISGNKAQKTANLLQFVATTTSTTTTQAPITTTTANRKFTPITAIFPQLRAMGIKLADSVEVAPFNGKASMDSPIPSDISDSFFFQNYDPNLNSSAGKTTDYQPPLLLVVLVSFTASMTLLCCFACGYSYCNHRQQKQNMQNHHTRHQIPILR